MTLPLAMILDALLGEPDWAWRRLPHPAVLMGRFVGWLDARLNAGPARRVKGVVALLALILVAGAAGWLITVLPLQPLPQIIAAAILLAQNSLAVHVARVADGLDIGLAEGRAAVAHIVGRDTEALDETGVARAAIESAAENFSDGVVAPAFWFMIFGLPGMLVYKAINTADSMIGYRTERHLEFGWAAARTDDVANFLPARLSAVLLAVGALRTDAFRVAIRDAAIHRSPNAGWPEAAAAAALDVSLAGPRVYDGELTDDSYVYAEGRAPGAAEIRAAVRLLWRGWGTLLAVALLVAAL